MTTRNLANEPGAWDADFSYGYLGELYAALRRDFVPTLLGDLDGPAPADGRPRAFVRHDIDVSLERAARLAAREVAWDVRSTYHVMIDSPFYDVRSASSRAALDAILGAGHEVGLHYDVVARGVKEADPDARERDVARACEELEAVVGRRTRSLSFHLPVPELVNGPPRVAGRVSGYGRDLFQWYLSDSRARWREGEPLACLGRPRSKNLQLLIHPIWWDESHAHPSIRLRDFLLELERQSEGKKSYGELRDRMWDHIIYDAADT
jgi:hypothetical protein